jgi:hypothetical protein
MFTPSDGSISNIASSLAVKTVASFNGVTLVFLKQSQYTYEYVSKAVV